MVAFCINKYCNHGRNVVVDIIDVVVGGSYGVVGGFDVSFYATFNVVEVVFEVRFFLYKVR